ncbi:MAG: hypothetical protein PHX61_07945 [Alphaproteobacteria bacterium]|nr:hypothetical protein [Alphaproteobacteria bacterium]
MFTEDTVFILGAGASWHYGYPTGEDLVKKIIEKAKSFADNLSENSPHPFRKDVFGSYTAKICNEEIPPFEYSSSRNVIRNNCYLLANRLVQTNALVIDYFLSQQTDAIQELGKFFIAWVIIECEATYFSGLNASGSNNCNRNRKIESGKAYKEYNDDWCRFLLHKIIGDCENNESASSGGRCLSDNKVKFITFNYDVSLEQNLLKGLQAFSDFFGQKKIEEFFSDDRFIHMYGQVRTDYFKDPTSISTKWDTAKRINPDFKAIYDASLQIRTIEGNKGEDQIFDRSKNVVRNAKRIFILGFGFDDRNCERLGLSTIHDSSAGNRVDICFTNFLDSDVVNKRANRLFDLDGRFYRGGRNLYRGPWNIYERSTVDVYRALAEDFEI